MNKVAFSDAAQALALRAVVGFIRRRTPAGASRLGGGIARWIGPWLPTSRVAAQNLRMAMPELGAAQHKRIIAEAWENLGATAAELMVLGDLRESATGPGYEMIGWDEHVAPVLAKGGPSISFTAHIGNWEIIPPAAFARGVDIGFMYRAASNRHVDALILRLREANFGRKISMFPKGAVGARQAYAHLVRGGHLAMLVDQKLDNGIAVPFFGHPAMTTQAMAAFALRFRCPVLPVHVVREGPARLRVIFEPPMELPDTGDKESDILTLTTQMNTVLEHWIREKPGAWLWLHRRWPKACYQSADHNNSGG